MRQFCILPEKWATCEYLHLCVVFAGDDRGRRKYCFLFMAVKEVRNGSHFRSCLKMGNA